MYKLIPTRGGLSNAVVRCASVVVPLVLIAGLAAYPMLDERNWRPATGTSSDANLNRLIEAIFAGDAERARRVLEMDTLNVNTLDAWGVTPLEHAIVCSRQHSGTGLVQLLLDHGADVDRADSWGHTPLMWALSLNNEAAAGLLLDAGANPNARRPDGATPLHVTSFSGGNAANVRRLLAAGADPTTRDRDGKTAADYARDSDLTEVTQILESGACSRPELARDATGRDVVSTEAAAIR